MHFFFVVPVTDNIYIQKSTVHVRYPGKGKQPRLKRMLSFFTGTCMYFLLLYYCGLIRQPYQSRLIVQHLITATCDHVCAGKKKCKPGQKLQNNKCRFCGKGEWSSGLTATCTKCQLGRYITKAGSAAGYPCSRCPPGTHSNKDGDQCKKCSSGRYSRSYGLSSGLQCLDCPRGRFGGDQGMTTFEQCTTCPAGRYGVIAGEKRFWARALLVHRVGTRKTRQFP